MTHTGEKVYPCTPPYTLMEYVGHGGTEVQRNCLRSQVSMSRQIFEQFYIKNNACINLYLKGPIHSKLNCAV
jgi:hypothetical protein